LRPCIPGAHRGDILQRCNDLVFSQDDPIAAAVAEPGGLPAGTLAAWNKKVLLLGISSFMLMMSESPPFNTSRGKNCRQGVSDKTACCADPGRHLE